MDVVPSLSGSVASTSMGTFLGTICAGPEQGQSGTGAVVWADGNDTNEVVQGPSLVVFPVAQCARSLPIPTLGRGPLSGGGILWVSSLPEGNRSEYLGVGKNVFTKTYNRKP